mmetsp:Transcript_46803/g.95722  ORF Transcript_46803/g.95722 Transcript_46803/m.95722 type:complete len:99 (-) Transcript_46803:39-335(-)
MRAAARMTPKVVDRDARDASETESESGSGGDETEVETEAEASEGELGAEPEMSSYEVQRQQRMATNATFLQRLGIEKVPAQGGKQRRKRKGRRRNTSQ